MPTPHHLRTYSAPTPHLGAEAQASVAKAEFSQLRTFRTSHVCAPARACAHARAYARLSGAEGTEGTEYAMGEGHGASREAG